MLVVEDEPSSLKALVRILTLHGYEVLPADNLQTAEAHLIWQPDFVLLDIMLPDGNGLDLLSRMRRRNDPAMVAVISAACDERPDQLAQLRPDAVFRKPVPLPALLAWLKDPLSARCGAGHEPTQC